MFWGKVLEVESSYIFLPSIILFQGLTSLALVRTTGRRRHFQEGCRALKKMSELVKNGAINCVHMLLILEAESLGVKRRINVDDVQTAFNKAICICGRSGFHQDKALACERAGVYHMGMNDHYYARLYLE